MPLYAALTSLSPNFREIRIRSIRNAGALAYFIGQFEESERYLKENLPIVRLRSEKGEISATLTGLAMVAVAQKRIAQALDFLKEAIVFAREAKEGPYLSNALNAFGKYTVSMADLRRQLRYMKMRVGNSRRSEMPMMERSPAATLSYFRSARKTLVRS